MTYKKSEEIWLANPLGETEHDATLIGLKLMRGKYRPNSAEPLMDRWRKTGLLIRQDPKTKKWGVICCNPDFEKKVRREKSQIEIYCLKFKYEKIKA